MMRAAFMGLAALLALVFGGSSANAQAKGPAAQARLKEVIACKRDPRVPDGVTIWVLLQGGKLFWDTPALHYKNLPKDAVLYIYAPGDPRCRTAPSVAPSLGDRAPSAEAAQSHSGASKAEPPEKDGEDKKRPHDVHLGRDAELRHIAYLHARELMLGAKP